MPRAQKQDRPVNRGFAEITVRASRGGQRRFAAGEDHSGNRVRHFLFGFSVGGEKEGVNTQPETMAGASFLRVEDRAIRDHVNRTALSACGRTPV